MSSSPFFNENLTNDKDVVSETQLEYRFIRYSTYKNSIWIYVPQKSRMEYRGNHHKLWLNIE